jgi:DNA mismatch repair protein MutL
MSSQRSIQLLPEHLIDQIKAGEVIERPSALLKELLENSVDANSSEIDIHIIEGGLELILVQDNGQGMEYDQLPMAFARHATSKIEHFDDLYRLHSYGFRGEALASAAAVSKLTCFSSPRDNPRQGGKILFEAGVQQSHTPYEDSTSGTKIYIRDLFYNTPARLKFVRSQAAEKNSLKKIIQAFLLAHPTIQFTVKWDDKAKMIYPAQTQESVIERMKQVLGSKSLIELNREYEDYKIQVYLSQESFKGHAGRSQLLFANHRLFFDKSLSQLLLRATEGLWETGESGHILVFLDVPAQTIDVNVHPNKTQVKFFQSSLVYSLISGTLKSHLEKQQLKKREVLPDQSQNLFRTDDLVTHSQAFIETPYNDQEQFHFSSVLDQVVPDKDWDIIRLSRFYFLFHFNQQWLVGDLPMAMGRMLFDMYKNKSQLSDKEISPLLISEPFKCLKDKIERHCSFLQTRGFDLDFLDKETIVLRAIPNFLDFNSKRFFVGEMLRFFAQSPKRESAALFDDFILNHYPIEDQLSQNIKADLSNWLQEAFWVHLENKVLIPLDDFHLKKLFTASQDKSDQ